MRKSFLIAMSAIATSLAAQNVNIPDSQFLDAVLNHDPVIDTDNDGEISVSEASAYTGSLKIGFKGIADLTGLEAFENITTLICRDNEFTSLDLSANTSLSSVYAEGNNLTTIDLSNMNLAHINLQSNGLTSINLTDASIGELRLGSNNLADVDFSQTSIINLSLNHNLFTTIDVSETANLGYLSCSDNPNLVYVNMHNGVDDLFGDSFLNVPNLTFICLDFVDDTVIESMYIEDPESITITDDCSLWLSTEELTAETNTYAYPNPVVDQLHIATNKQVQRIEIYNQLGQLLLQENNSNQIDVQTLAKGIYIVKSTDIAGHTQSQSFVKSE